MDISWEPSVQTAPNGAPNITHYSPEVQKRSGWADTPPGMRFKVKTTAQTSAAVTPSSSLDWVLGGQKSLVLKMQTWLWTCVPGQRAFPRGEEGRFFPLCK